MNKKEDNKADKLLNEITKAFEMLRKTLDTFDAFKIVFILLHYKRFNDIVKNCDGFDHCVDFISSNEILPEEYRWQHLNEVPAHQIFTQIDTSLFNIYSCNNAERFGGTGKPLNIQKYQSNVPATTQKKLVDLFSSLDLTLKGLSHKEFEYVVWQCEEKYINAKDKVSYTPLSLSKLIVKLFNIHSDERIYIPFCSFDNLFITTIDHAYAGSQYDESDDIDIYLNGKNEELLALQELRFSTAVVSNASTRQQLYYPSSNPRILLFNIKYLNQDTSEILLPSLRNRQNTKTDIIFLNPTFGIRQPDHLPPKVNIDGSTLEIPKNYGEIFELLNHLQNLSDHGRMCIVMRFGILFSGGKVRNIRKFLIDNDYIEAVLQLPEKLFSHTHISAAILVINKSKPKSRKHKTLFVKVESALVGNKIIISDEEVDRVVNTYNKTKSDVDAIVTLEEIQQQDYDLSPGKYIGALSSEIKKLIETKAGIALGELCTITKGYSNRPVAGIHDGVPFITTKNLSKDVTEPFLNLEEVEKFSQPITILYSGICVIDFSKKCVLISLVGSDLKPTIFDPDYDSKVDYEEGDAHEKHTSIVPENNIAAISPNESIVDFEYFYYQLYSSIVKKQLNSIIVDTGVPHINITSLSKVIIPVPKTQEEQRAFVKEQKSLLLEIENNKLEAIKVKLGIPEKKQEAEFEIIRHLAHDIKSNINVVGAPLRTISVLLKQEGLLDKVVSVRLDGAKVSARETINNALEGLSKITNVLESARDIVTREIKRTDFKKTAIADLFENNIKRFYKDRPYQITIECKDKDKDLEVSLHVKSFVGAIDNIVRNAEIHAFSGDIASPELRFEISEDINEETIIIDYTNNGHKFPLSMKVEEFLSFGTKSSESNGEGLGGAWIGKVIDAHGGELDIIRDNNPVHFKITIPKELK
jgi:type I restriction-modification system DNA methylase subunit